MKLIKPLLLFLFTTIAFTGFSQTVIVPSSVKLPDDTIIRNQLINSLNGFLSQKENPNNQNSYVFKADLLETSDLLDEIKGMEQNNALKADNFYKCYLTNAIGIDEDNFIIQIAYIGISNNTPVLHAGFRLLAKRIDGKFFFNSPLKQNTIGWRSKKLGMLTCYYKDTLTLTAVRQYQKTVLFYDKKLGGKTYPTAFYYCDNFAEVQQLIGIDYKSDYNSIKYNSLTSHENNLSLILNGNDYSWQRFNAHDLWHERLRLVVAPAKINRPVDEGCAYLYGGDWSFTWNEVLAKFKKYAANNPNADWLKLYINNTAYEYGDKPMIISYVLNALVVQKIEAEKGFAQVMELLSCGHRQDGDENYFTALNKIAGINKGNFNVKMWELIKAAN